MEESSNSLKRTRSADEEHTVGKTPPLESPSSVKSQKTENASSVLDKMIELCVNKDAAAGLDVAALVNKLRMQDQMLERLGTELAEQREANEGLSIRVLYLQRTDLGAVVAENQQLREQLRSALEERDQARALLEGARGAALVQAVATGPLALKKKRWKKPDDGSSAPKDEPEEEAPVKRTRSIRSSTSTVVDVDAMKDREEFFLDDSMTRSTVTVREEDNAITAEADEHYDAFYKGGVRFAIGENVYLKSGDAPFLGRLDRIFRRDKGDVQVLVQVEWKEKEKWWFRWDDLPPDQEEHASPLAQKRELWLSEKKEPNPASTVIGKLNVKNGLKMSKAEMEAFLGESEHNFFTRKFYDTLSGKVVKSMIM